MSAPDLDALVASPHWKWAECVRLIDGQTIVEVFRDRLVTFHRVDGDRIIGWIEPHRARPDVDHPANHGHLLALVRKAWGPGYEIEVFLFADGGCSVQIYNGLGGRFLFPADSLGLALTAALLAAPEGA